MDRLRRRVTSRLDVRRLLGALRNKVVVALGAHAGLQESSDAFWRTSDSTYLAPADYYDRREAALTALLAELPPLRGVIDVGCGDGRFTCLLARSAQDVEGYDISPALVDRAERRARTDGLTHTRFFAREIDALATGSRYHLVACMGVTSCIVDEAKFARLLDRLRGFVEPDGYLLMVDSLSTSRARTVAYRNGYVARYRPASDYLRELRARGFALEQRVVIQQWSGLSNELMLFTCPPEAPPPSPPPSA